mgnify:CR=1 FL=1
MEHKNWCQTQIPFAIVEGITAFSVACTCTRMTKQDYYFALAMTASLRATCPRASVGAVAVRDGRVVATGYNGAPSGAAHCIDVGCEIVDGHCKRVQHAERNLGTQAMITGVSLSDTTVYVYDSQFRQEACEDCAMLLYGGGVIGVYLATEEDVERISAHIHRAWQR